LDNTITILFLSADPQNTPPLELTNECNDIQDELQYARGAREEGKSRNEFRLEQRHDISIRELRRQIQNYDPQIVHFSGHGSPRSALVFKNDEGEVEIVPSNALSDLFELLSEKVSLVFLNACYSEEQAKSISKHIDYVIGMSKAISDVAARKFAGSFYSSLGFGESVDRAFKFALTDLKLLSIPEEETPKLLIKDGVDVSKPVIWKKLNEENGKKPSSICEQLDKFNEQLDKVLFNEISLKQFFEVIHPEMSKFLRDPQSKKKFGEPRISSLNMLLINLSNTIHRIQTSEDMQDKQEAVVNTNRATAIARQIIDNISSICSGTRAMGN
jgi:hypothetical protein